jgi:hypothetical protein
MNDPAARQYHARIKIRSAGVKIMKRRVGGPTRA